MIVAIGVCIFLFAVEELMHLYYRRAGLLESTPDVDTTGTSGERGAVSRLNTVRWLQLVAICVLFAMTGDMTRFGFFGCAAGQTGVVLIVMQIVRIIGRKMVNRWIVLGILQLQQLLLLVLLPLMKMPVQAVVPAERVHSVILWVSGVSGAVGASALGIAFSFCTVYLIRLMSRESSRIFSVLPPLVYSESWTRRLTGMAMLPVFLTVAGLTLLSVSRNQLEPALVPALLVLGLLTAALDRFRKQDRFHHPAGNILTFVAVVVVFAATILGHTTFIAVQG